MKASVTTELNALRVNPFRCCEQMCLELHIVVVLVSYDSTHAGAQCEYKRIEICSVQTKLSLFGLSQYDALMNVT